ncbi:SDR family oxidoreductase [Thermodesulfobacteriota bacterium]
MRILLTGATGYIGRRLKDRLLCDPEISLRLLVRNKTKLRLKTLIHPQVEVVEGDTFQADCLAEALRDVDVAYYLIHSLAAKGADYEQLDRQSAENFRDACIVAGVRRIIYLGGLGLKQTASKHLRSRIETGEILSARPEAIQTVWIRAGVIIGAGSASFEIIRNLSQKLPLMITPLWVNTLTQPIGVNDVLGYLTAALELEVKENLIVDIGAEPMSFRQMLQQASQVMGLRRWILPVPVLTPRLSSYWLILFTPVPYGLAAALIEGLRSETVSQNDNAALFFEAIEPLTYREAVFEALQELEHDEVVSRWCDSSAGVLCDIRDQDDPGNTVLRDRRQRSCSAAIRPRYLFEAACELGGEAGWGRYNLLWRLRGMIDKLLGGYGLNRGRRNGLSLRRGDALDFWKVADIQPGKRLLLVAEMKLPGKAWLEFVVDDDGLTQTAHFLPRGVWGRLYWQLVLPLHHLVFDDLADQVVKRARGLARKARWVGSA